MLPDHRKQRPAVVCRFEWQRRVLVPDADLDYVWERNNQRNQARGYYELARMARLREEFLHAFFVRRLRFDSSCEYDLNLSPR